MQLAFFDDMMPATTRPPQTADGLTILSEQRVDEDVLITLQAATVSEGRVYLPPELERSLYLRVNEVLERLLGKWRRSAYAHVFPYDPTPMVTAVLETGLMPVKNPAAFFLTPEPVIDCMFEWPNLGPLEWKDYRVLEPSAGQGAIAERLRLMYPNATLDVCELVGLNRNVLNQKGFDVCAHDFLTYQPDEGYHLIMMNPPFSVEGDRLAYITHIRHAWELLRPGGRLVAITPAGWTFSTKSEERHFRQMVCDFGYFAELERDAFRGSGTGVQTYLIWLNKRADGQSPIRQPHQGCNSFASWEVSMMRACDFKRHDAYWAIIQRILSDKHPSYTTDLTGAPVGRAAEDLIYLYRNIERDAIVAESSVYLTDEDIEYLLREAGADALEEAAWN